MQERPQCWPGGASESSQQREPAHRPPGKAHCCLFPRLRMPGAGGECDIGVQLFWNAESSRLSLVSFQSGQSGTGRSRVGHGPKPPLFFPLLPSTHFSKTSVWPACAEDSPKTSGNFTIETETHMAPQAAFLRLELGCVLVQNVGKQFRDMGLENIFWKEQTSSHRLSST